MSSRFTPSHIARKQWQAKRDTVRIGLVVVATLAVLAILPVWSVVAPASLECSMFGTYHGVPAVCVAR